MSDWKVKYDQLNVCPYRDVSTDTTICPFVLNQTVSQLLKAHFSSQNVYFSVGYHLIFKSSSL